VRKKTIIPTRIRVSFHKNEIPTPLSIIPLRIMINHFAGIILLMYCNAKGILEIGKINPDSKMTGSINPIKEIIIAVCCVAEIVDIRIPRANEVTINKTVSKANRIRLPSIGISNTKYPKSKIIMAFMIDRNM
jgi:hypothetical protein